MHAPYAHPSKIPSIGGQSFSLTAIPLLSDNALGARRSPRVLDFGSRPGQPGDMAGPRPRPARRSLPAGIHQPPRADRRRVAPRGALGDACRRAAGSSRVRGGGCRRRPRSRVFLPARAAIDRYIEPATVEQVIVFGEDDDLLGPPPEEERVSVDKRPPVLVCAGSPLLEIPLL